jgi:hypothetical protein
MRAAMTLAGSTAIADAVDVLVAEQRRSLAGRAAGCQ